MRQQVWLKRTDPEDALMMGYNFRKMIAFIEKTYPKISRDIIIKVLDITPFEIKTLNYTPSQYKKLEAYCKLQGFRQ